METIREIKTRARGQLHSAMSVPALYVRENPPDFEIVEEAGEDGLINVRLHVSTTTMGEVQGTSFNYAERADIIPRIVFLVAEVSPVRNDIVSIADGEAWRIDNVLVVDGITVTAEVKRILNTTGIPVPA